MSKKNVSSYKMSGRYNFVDYLIDNPLIEKMITELLENKK